MLHHGPKLRFAALVATTLTLLPVQVANAVVTPPGGRANYVTAVMADNGQSSWVRLAQYSFRSDGTVREDFWFWDQNTITGSASTGITTSGCTYTCAVRTAERFQDGHSTYPRTLYGTYSVLGTTVSVTWSSGSSETWRLTNQSTASRLVLASSSYGATHGWSWGSTKGFSYYATISNIKTQGGPYRGSYQQNNWGGSMSGTTTLNLSGFTLCNGSCLNQTTATTKLYLAGPNSSRKTFYNRQRFDVDPSSCIGTGGGHLNPFLQIIDDDGLFRGWVGVEASLYGQDFGGAIVGIYDLNNFDAPTAAVAPESEMRLRLQIAPNPMRSRTTISGAFGRAGDGQARLTITDARGRYVLQCGLPLVRGRVTWEWNRRSTDGNRAMAGVYFVELRHGEETLRSRVVVWN